MCKIYTISNILISWLCLLFLWIHRNDNEKKRNDVCIRYWNRDYFIASDTWGNLHKYLLGRQTSTLVVHSKLRIILMGKERDYSLVSIESPHSLEFYPSFQSSLFHKVIYAVLMNLPTCLNISQKIKSQRFTTSFSLNELDRSWKTWLFDLIKSNKLYPFLGYYWLWLSSFLFIFLGKLKIVIFDFVFACSF